jgi:5-hydroxyisourate hydrolase/2-oxo-4-hydroxy-4-carboxy-5-ureidoimidazoline decarboxylase
MIQSKPFKSPNEVIEKSNEIWFNACDKRDYLEAFTGHPKIGDVESLQDKYSSSKEWAGKEQANVAKANQQIIEELFHFNQLYEERFGFIFIVSASGKTAEEMLRLLKVRYENDPVTELGIAMMEQQKITTIRLAKLISEMQDTADMTSHITTHVLDTSIGKPGKGMLICLKSQLHKQWETIALGITNDDGRISNLLPPGKKLPKGSYKMEFDSGNYYAAQNQTGFYPEIKINFDISDANHYHIPLLISPFGYSTYRGS